MNAKAARKNNRDHHRRKMRFNKLGISREYIHPRLWRSDPVRKKQVKSEQQGEPGKLAGPKIQTSILQISEKNDGP